MVLPAIEKAKEAGIMAFGPFPADSFFGAQMHTKYDAVLAMYHDQGLAPFKSLSFGEGVNFTAGLEKVRTSPDHGTAYDLAGKELANINSFKEAVFSGIQIFKTRREYKSLTENTLKRARQKEKR